MNGMLESFRDGGLSSTGLGLLLDASAKGIVVVLVAFGVSLLLRRASAASRHLIWLLALVMVVLMPFTSLVLPEWQCRILPARTPVTDSLNDPTPTPHVMSVEDRSITNDPIQSAPVMESPSAHGELPLEGGEPTIAVTESIRPLAASLAADPPVDETSPPPAENEAHFLHRSTWVLLGWLVGGLLVAAPCVLGTWRARRTVRRGTSPEGEMWFGLRDILPASRWRRRRPEIRLSDEIRVPMAWGLFRPVILLPGEVVRWSPHRLHMVLLHESAHIRRWDCLSQMVGQLACAIYWFNPLVWIAFRRIVLEREQACDDVVVAAGTRPSDYADQLFEIIRSLHPSRSGILAGVAMARRSQIEGRLLAILDARRNRGRLTRRILAAGIAMSALIALPLGTVRLAARAAEKEGSTEDINTSLEAVDTAENDEAAEKETAFDGTLPGVPEDKRLGVLMREISAGRASHVNAVLDVYPELKEGKLGRDETPLYEAAMRNNREMAKLLIARGAKVDAGDDEGFTILDRCANYGLVEMGALLLDHGANPDAASDNDWRMRPIHTAISEGEFDFVKLLVARGADINAEARDGLTPVQFATMLSQMEIARYLADQGARLDLVSAAGLGRIDLVKGFVEKNPEAIKTGPFGRTPLYAAAAGGQSDVARFLVEQGAEVDARDQQSGFTPLSASSYNGHAEVAAFLLEAGADIESADKRGRRPIELACFPNGHSKALEVLLDHRANTDGALYSAANSGWKDCVELLLARGVDVNEGKSSHKDTPLHAAAGRGYTATAEILLNAGADVNARGERDRTPLHAATFGLGDELASIVVELLLEAGADINAQDEQGDTALHQAGESQNTLSAKVLLAAGPDLTLKNKRGQTPRDASARPVVELIDRYTQKGNIKIPEEERIRASASAFLGSIANGYPRWYLNLILEHAPNWTDEDVQQAATEVRNVYKEDLTRLYKDPVCIYREEMAAVQVPGPTDDSNRYLYLILQPVSYSWFAVVYMDDSPKAIPLESHLAQFKPITRQHGLTIRPRPWRESRPSDAAPEP